MPYETPKQNQGTKAEQGLLADQQLIESALHEALHVLDDPHTIEKKEAVRSFYENVEKLAAKHGVSLEEGNIYARIGQREYLVRRGNLERELVPLLSGRDIDIASRRESGNAAVDTPEGVSTAMTEGVSGAEIAFLYGFSDEHVETQPITLQEGDLRGKARERIVRTVSGTVPFEDVRYIVLRIPKDLFPHDLLNESEADSENPFVFRSIDLREWQPEVVH